MRSSLLTSRPSLCLSVGAALGLASLAACSIVNAPDDPVDPTTSSSSVGGMGVGGVGGSGGAGGTGGSPPAECGNGTVEGDEECDQGMETAECNADCTTSECADGVVNRAAGEQCDDGNMDTGDACSPDCEATPFTIDDNIGTSFDTFAAPLGAMVTRDMADNEQFAVVWTRIDVNMTPFAASLTVLTPDGQQLASDVPVATNNDGDGLDVAYNSQGRGVAVWRSTGAAGELRFRVIGPGGMPANAAESVLPGADPRRRPVVGASPDGGFCVAWIDASDNTLRVRALSDNGLPVGSNQTLEGATVSGNGNTFRGLSVVGIRNGFVVTYNTLMDEARGQLIGLDGNPQGGPFALWEMGLNGHFGNGAGSSDNASFIAVGTSQDTFGQGAPEERAIVRRFQSAGNPSGAATLLGDVHMQEVSPWIARSTNGGPSLVVWSRLIQVPNVTACELLMQRFDAQGQPLGAAGQVTAPPPNSCLVRGTPVVNSAGDVFMPFIEGYSTPTQGRLRAIIFRRMLEAP